MYEFQQKNKNCHVKTEYFTNTNLRTSMMKAKKNTF